MKYILVSKSKYNDLHEDLKSFISSDLGQEISDFVLEGDLEYIQKIVEVSKEIAAANREGIALISLDETGGLAFAAASKVKGMIASQISDEHSSHMTREHNGSVGLNLGADVSAPAMIKSIVKLYVEERFAAGRHMVRVDMLDDMA